MAKPRTRDNLRRDLVSLAVASCFAAGTALANPVGPTVVHGSASVVQNGNLLQISNSPSAIINWQSFSIGVNEVTRFIQQSQASAVLNRVTGAGSVIDPSVILGALQSNGRLFLINPSGILFGAQAQIDVAGLVASSLNLSDADFLANRLSFTEAPGAGAVVNQGGITTGAGGNVYLVGPAVTNSGIITSSRGEVILAAGNSVELVDPGTPDLRVEVAAAENAARNLGQIIADSGRIGIYAGLISHSGTIRADTVEVGKNGEILLRASRNSTLEPGSVISASGAAGGAHEGGTARIVSDGTLEMRNGSVVRVDGGVDGGDGGFLELSGHGSMLLEGHYSGRAQAAGYRSGTLLLDPDFVDVLSPLDGVCLAELCLDPATAFLGFRNVVVDAGLDLFVRSAIGDGDLNSGASLALNAGRGLSVLAPIGTFAVPFNHDLSLNAGTDVVVNSDIILGPNTLTLAADATLTPSINVVSDGIGDVRISPMGFTPVTVDTLGPINVSGVNFSVGSPTARGSTSVVAGTDLNVTIAGTLAVHGGDATTASGATDASALLAARRDVAVTARGIVVAGGTARAESLTPLQEERTADAEFNAVRAMTLDVGAGGVTVAGGTASAQTFLGSSADPAPVHAAFADAVLGSNILVTHDGSAPLTINTTGGITVRGGDNALAGAQVSSDFGIAITQAKASVVALFNDLTVTASGLTVRGGDFAQGNAKSNGVSLPAAVSAGGLSEVDVDAVVSAGSMVLDIGSGPVVIRGGDLAVADARDNGSSFRAGTGQGTVNASAGLTAFTDISLTAGGVTVRGGDNALAAAGLNGFESGAGIGAARVIDNATVSAFGNLSVNASSLTVRGGNGAYAGAASNADFGGFALADANIETKGSLSAAFGDMTLVVSGPLAIQGGASAFAGACCSASFGGSAGATMSTDASADVSSFGRISLTSGSLEVRGGDNAYALACCNGSDDGIASGTATARSNASLLGTSGATIVAGGITVRGGDNARAVAGNSADIDVPNGPATDSTALVEAGGSAVSLGNLAVTASSLAARGGDNAAASATGPGQNVATIKAVGDVSGLATTSLAVSGAITVHGGNDALATAILGTAGATNTAEVEVRTSAGGLGNLSISAGSLSVQGGAQSGGSGALASDLGVNAARTNANARVDGAEVFYGGGPVSIRGGLARTEGGSGVNEATARAESRISSLFGTTSLNIAGKLDVVGGSALDDPGVANLGGASAGASIDQAFSGLLSMSTTGNVAVTGGTRTGAGSATAIISANNPIVVTVGGATGLTLTGGTDTQFSPDPNSAVTLRFTGGGALNIVSDPALDSAQIFTSAIDLSSIEESLRDTISFFDKIALEGFVQRAEPALRSESDSDEEKKRRSCR